MRVAFLICALLIAPLIAPAMAYAAAGRPVLEVVFPAHEDPHSQFPETDDEVLEVRKERGRYLVTKTQQGSIFGPVGIAPEEFDEVMAWADKYVERLRRAKPTLRAGCVRGKFVYLSPKSPKLQREFCMDDRESLAPELSAAVVNRFNALVFR